MERHLHDEPSLHDESSLLPEIILGDSEHARLTSLATAALDKLPQAAEELLTELDRATVVTDEAVPDHVIRMGSTVEFRADGDRKRVTLVFPVEADIAAGKVSVLTPVGASLIGLSQGESMSWSARDGTRHELTVLAVEPPAS
ncbi:MAG TPA: nucleoside diphosphate kinase regulator [Dongiaceae bacterium]